MRACAVSGVGGAGWLELAALTRASYIAGRAKKDQFESGGYSC